MKRIFAALALAVLLLFGSVSAEEEPFEIIRQGAKGETVVRIQERLFDLGYYTYKPTGSYQTVTRSAVVAYQVASGLMSDGTIGKESLSALFAHNAVRAPFHAYVPLTYTAQSGTLSRGIAQRWEIVKQQLVEGETCSMVFQGGENHADFAVPTRGTLRDATTQRMLAAWLGETNSFYKCAVLLTLDGQPVAASIQWNGDDAICLYVAGSTSHIFGLPDPDHEAMLQRITN